MLTVNSLTGFGIGSNSVGGGGGGSRPPYELVHADSDDADEPSEYTFAVIVEHSGAGDAQGCVIKVLSLSGVASTTAHDTDSEFGDVAGGSATLDIPEDGILIVGVAREKHDRAVTIGNATEIIDEAFGVLGRVVLAVNDSLPSQSNRPVSWTATAGGAAGTGFICKSYG
jgi:hypothetical protein